MVCDVSEFVDNCQTGVSSCTEVWDVSNTVARGQSEVCVGSASIVICQAGVSSCVVSETCQFL